MSTNYISDAGSGVAQYKKLCVRGLGRGSRWKSKQLSPPASPCGSYTFGDSIQVYFTITL